ncbi:MAG TPA: DHA2 family efflux MFS transporter permease subunit [Candidatus Binataceae bacterium]|nr:DHA2 family efflux MFS transporter permease subunit [Candidatus Binataceae bacterium]
MAAAPSQNASPPEHGSVAVNKWLIAVAVMLATIMEVLDTTIANVALLHIRGSLSAGVDEAAWVLTSYIVANAIVIPLTGWCGAFFGRKRFFTFSILLFVTSSLLAGASPNLPTLIFFRVLQGIGGGAMMPMSQAILMETFPPEQQAVAMAVWGVGMMLGPVMGPVLGGWITDNYSWRWIFYINVPIGLIAATMVAVFVHDPDYIRRGIKKIDWWGIIFLAIGVGFIQVMLDKGDRLDWFNSKLIVELTVIGTIGVVLFLIRELRTKEPVVELRVLNNRTFAVGTVFTTIVMFAMYGTYVLIPLYCQQIAGYTPLQAGFVLSIQSFGTFASIMLAGRLFTMMDPRVLIAGGCLIAGYGTWGMANFNPQIDFWNIAMPGIYRGIGSGLIFIPITTLSLGAVSNEEMGNASGLFNMVRSVGGSIGIAILVAMVSRHTQIHQSYLSARIDPFRFQEWSHSNPGITAQYNRFTLHGAAPYLGMIYQEVQRQAAILAYVDDFRLISYIFLFLTPLAFVMRRPAKMGTAPAVH